jgi:hypothetical protein
VTKYSQAVDEFQALEPAKYSFLESLELRRDFQSSGPSDLDLLLALRRSPLTENGHLKLVFKGIQDLKFGDIDHMDGIFVEIRDIRERQLEWLNYRVVDSEECSFSFCCRDFSASLEEIVLTGNR